MFASDNRQIQRLEPYVRRALIVDPHPGSARLLGELLKGLGARQLAFEPEERRALEMARELDPGLIFVERSGARLDGESFTRRLRRSNYACRKAPVIMVTSDATASSIKGARDAGVHEFLRKPFTAGDLLKRIEVCVLKQRDWIEAVQYVGPDRRRFNSGEYAGPRKRRADTGAAGKDAVQADHIDRCLRILRSALAQWSNDPVQALRAVGEQTQQLKKLASAKGEARLAVAVGGLELALSAGSPSRELLANASAEVIDAFGGIRDVA
ncbi:MAG: response regulator [Caulobacteraceae bacterium]|nr:response regulator [Caulobacteraceae bacterium]